MRFHTHRNLIFRLPFRCRRGITSAMRWEMGMGQGCHDKRGRHKYGKCAQGLKFVELFKIMLDGYGLDMLSCAHDQGTIA